MDKKSKVFLLFIAGILISLFAMLCFVEFFFAWNLSSGRASMMQENNNFGIDLRCAFPINEASWRMMALPEIFSFLQIKESVLGEMDGNKPIGFLVFTKEHWMFAGLVIVSILLSFTREFFPNLLPSKATATPFIMLTALMLWITVTDFVGSWQYMYGTIKESSNHWQMYQSPLADVRMTEKWMTYLPLALQAAQNLLLVATFASAAWVISSDKGKELFFVPALLAAISAGVAFVCNLTGFGFSLKWEMTSALFLLAVDALLVASLFLFGKAVSAD